MRYLKNTVVALLRLLGTAMALALIILLIEVVVGVLLVEFDTIFR